MLNIIGEYGRPIFDLREWHGKLPLHHDGQRQAPCSQNFSEQLTILILWTFL